MHVCVRANDEGYVQGEDVKPHTSNRLFTSRFFIYKMVNFLLHIVYLKVVDNNYS